MLNNIKFVFFDVDDTIFDFDKCGEKVIKDAFGKFSLPYSATVFPTFKTINKGFWKRIEKGEIDRDYLSAHRFNAVFADLGINFDGPMFEKEFLRGLHYACEEVDGAIETVRSLSKNYPLFVASNAFYAQQINRLSLAGIADCFKDVFVSEKMGCNKPSPEFFAKMLALAGVDKPETALMVGDSLEADIIGAKNAGMKTFWLTDKNGDEHADVTSPDITLLSKILL